MQLQIIISLLFISLLWESCVPKEAPATAVKANKKGPVIRFDKAPTFFCFEERTTNFYSPINILSKPIAKNQHPLTLFFQEEQEQQEICASIKLAINKDSSLFFEGKHYVFKGLHVHQVPEHLIDGLIFPLELHVLFQHKEEKLLLALLFKAGTETTSMAALCETILKGEEKSRITMSDLFSTKEACFYNYTIETKNEPPLHCLLSQHIFELSPRHLAVLKG